METNPFDKPRVLRVWSVLVYLFLFTPILVVILFSFNSIKSLTNFEGFSLQWYEEFLNDPDPARVAVRLARDRFPDHARGNRDRHHAGDRPRPLACPMGARARTSSCSCRWWFPRSSPGSRRC